VNSKVGSQMTIYHSYAVQICFHRRPLAGITSLYWNVSCHEYYTYPASSDPLKPITNVDTVLLRDTPYYVGIALFDPLSTDVDTINFVLGSSGDDCPHQQVYNDRENCVNATFMNETLATPPSNWTLDEVRYFYFTVPSNRIGSIMAYSTNGESKLIFLFRFMGTPTNYHKDGQAGSTAYLPFPRPGEYFMRVRATENITDYSFALRFEHCNSTNSSGPSCTSFYNVSEAWLDVPSRANAERYWHLFVPAGTLASVSIRPDDGDLWNYQLFAARGQLPQLKNADISYCYGSGCSGALTINITDADPNDQYWYIGVVPAHNNRTYGIWFNSVCAPGCENHGLCQYGGPEIGKCNCAADYIGSGCQISDTLSAQYIVLIIIACLLFTSGIVGFIAQAYLKRKGVGYTNI